MAEEAEEVVEEAEEAATGDSAKKLTRRPHNTTRTIQEKLVVIDFAEKNGNRAAAARFKCDNNLVRYYRRQKVKYETATQAVASLSRLPGSGRKPAHEAVEEKLIDWVKQMRAGHQKVRRERLQEKARELFAESGGAAGEFKASNGWLQKFMNRYSLSLRRGTTVSQKPPADFIPKLVDFVLFVRKRRLEHKYALSAMYAADETGVWVDCSGNVTVDFKGVKDVPLRTTGHDRLRITVMLTARADGKKLKPFVLIPRKRPLPELENQLNNKVVVAYTGAGKSWMDDATTAAYLRDIIGTLSFRNRLLVWDSFTCHFSKATKKVMGEMKLDSAIIPGGCTKFIQAPDVSWNAPFKAHLSKSIDSWREKEKPELTRGGNPKAPNFGLVCKWVLEAWQALSEDLIIKSFKCCGVSSATDGSEDDQITCFKPGQPCEAGLQVLREKASEVEQIEQPSDESDNDYEVEL